MCPFWLFRKVEIFNAILVDNPPKWSLQSTATEEGETHLAVIFHYLTHVQMFQLSIYENKHQ